MKRHYSTLLILAACTLLAVSACGSNTSSTSSSSDDATSCLVDDSSNDDSSVTSLEDSQSGNSSSLDGSTSSQGDSSTTVNATIHVFDDYPKYLDIGDTLDLDEYVAVADGSDYVAEVTSGKNVVSVSGHTLNADSYGEYTITLTSSYETATFNAYVNSPTMTSFEALLEDIDRNYVAEFVIGNTIYATVSHNEDYYGLIDYIYSSIGGAVRLGDYGYAFNATQTDFSDAVLQSGAYNFDDLYLAGSFPVGNSDLIDLYNNSGDVLIDGNAAYYLSYYTIGYNLNYYGVEFYALSTVESDGETYYWFTGYSGNDTDGYTYTGYHIRIHSVNEVYIDALEKLIVLNNIPNQMEHDALSAAFATLNSCKNYTMNMVGYYYDSTNGESVSNSSSTAKTLASIGFALPYTAVSYVNDVTYYAEILSGYCIADTYGSYTSIAGDVYSINQYTSGGVTDTAVLAFEHGNDGYTFLYGAFTDEFETAWDTTLTPSSIDNSSLNKVNFLENSTYMDEGVTNYQYTFDGLTDNGVFLESLTRMMPVYGDSVFEYFASYADESGSWMDVFDSSNCVIACTDEGDIYGQIATYSFRTSSTQAYRYIMYFEITDIGDTLIDNEYLTTVDWSQVH